MIYILIQAGEGDTEDIYIAKNKSELITKIKTECQKEIDSYPDEDKEFAENDLGGFRDSLIEMLNQHNNWKSGRYILENIEPQWQEWTLVIFGEK